MEKISHQNTRYRELFNILSRNHHDNIGSKIQFKHEKLHFTDVIFSASFFSSIGYKSLPFYRRNDLETKITSSGTYLLYIRNILFLNLFYDKKVNFYILQKKKKRSRKYHVSCLVQLERLAQYLHCTAHCSCLEFILQNDESRQIFPHF